MNTNLKIENSVLTNDSKQSAVFASLSNAKSALSLVKIPSRTRKFFQRVKMKVQNSFSTLGSAERLKTSIECLKCLERARQEKQQNFDKQIDHFLKDFLIQHFKQTVDEMRYNCDENISPRSIYRELCYNLLKNAVQRYKTKGRNNCDCNNKVTFYRMLQQREFSCNGIRGTYRKLFEGFDMNTPYKVKTENHDENGNEKAGEYRFQIYWNMESLTPQAKFVFDFELNKLFDDSNRSHRQAYSLLSHHPHLIRYPIDLDDLQWFTNQDLLKSMDHIAKSTEPRVPYVLLLEQILELPKKYGIYRRYYGDSDFNMLRSFTLPEFMLKKMRLFCIRLQIRSDGFITTVKPPQKRPLPSIENCDGLKNCSDFDNVQSSVYECGSTSSPLTADICSEPSSHSSYHSVRY